MKLFSQLRQKIKPVKQARDPFGVNHRNITFVMTIYECWPSMSKQEKQQIVAWAKQNLWNDHLAYAVLVKLRNGELKV